MDERVFKNPNVFDPMRFFNIDSGSLNSNSRPRSGESLHDSDSGFASLGISDDNYSMRNMDKGDGEVGGGIREGGVKNGFMSLPFGFGDGNPGKCAGRSYAQGIFTIIATLILTRFHIEIEPESGHEPSIPSPSIAGHLLGKNGLVKFSPCDRGLGVIRPKGDLKVRISTRQWSS